VTQVILITGAPGVGKTSVAQLLAASLGGTMARLSGDVFILAVTPFEISDDRRLFLRENLTSFVRHSIEHGYDWIVVECVIPSDEFVRDLIDAIGIDPDQFTVVSLLADRTPYEERLRTKLIGHATTAANFQTCHEWMDRIRHLTLPTPIDTSSQSAEETTAAVMRLIDAHSREKYRPPPVAAEPAPATSRCPKSPARRRCHPAAADEPLTSTTHPGAKTGFASH
jgi:hypothetical protein